MDNKQPTSDKIESRRREWLHLAMIESDYFASDHTVKVCDATTGHSVTAVAFCDNESRAAVFVQMMNEYKSQITQLAALTARVAELEGALRYYAEIDNLTNFAHAVSDPHSLDDRIYGELDLRICDKALAALKPALVEITDAKL